MASKMGKGMKVGRKEWLTMSLVESLCVVLGYEHFVVHTFAQRTFFLEQFESLFEDAFPTDGVMVAFTDGIDVEGFCADGTFWKGGWCVLSGLHDKYI